MSNVAPPGAPVFVRPDFFERTTCVRIREAMDEGRADEAEIVGDEIARERTVRSARMIEIDEPVRELAERHLDSARPVIERVFGLPLGAREGVGFLRYQTGDFYRPHRDRGEVAGWPPAALRRITVVVFLNGGEAGDGPRDFEGGHLSLYLENGSPLHVTPMTGLLVAFPADLLHEVQPVVRGTRDALIDWFLQADGRTIPEAGPYMIPD